MALRKWAGPGLYLLLLVLVCIATWTVLGSSRAKVNCPDALAHQVSGAPQEPLIVYHNAHCQPPREGGFERVLFATVPRSGNHFFRAILEWTTGVATETVYSSEGLTT